MSPDDWYGCILRLTHQLETIQYWKPSPPDPNAERCEQSRHRTLAHLRASQEQWLSIVKEFIEHDSPNFKVLHPWRQFDRNDYANLPWQDHMEQFIEDRLWWLSLSDTVDWNRGGKWNRKPDTVAGLTKRLAEHEAHHIKLLEMSL